jgi:hypothetical protein
MRDVESRDFQCDIERPYAAVIETWIRSTPDRATLDTLAAKQIQNRQGPIKGAAKTPARNNVDGSLSRFLIL